jgi:hypothetical protein
MNLKGHNGSNEEKRNSSRKDHRFENKGKDTMDIIERIQQTKMIKES